MNKNHKGLDIQRRTNISAKCSHCLVKHLCMCDSNISNDEEQALDKLIHSKKNYHKGDIIYKAGDEFKNLYAIRIGSVKIYSINEQGDEQITSFHMSGDVIGFDAIADNEHLSFAQALESTSICEIPFFDFQELNKNYPALNLRLLKLISQEISTKKNLMMMISKQTAEQRLASFLLHLINNLKQRKLSQEQIKLTMTRYEIGNYISLTVETISRILTKFQENNIIEVSGKYITILNPDSLEKILL